MKRCIKGEAGGKVDEKRVRTVLWKRDICL